MLLFRIDNRLIHGQIIEAWLPYMHAKHLIIANDALADDNLRQQIMSLAVPCQTNILFLHLDELPQNLQKFRNEKTMVIFETCHDTAKILSQDIPTPRINVGNLHFAQGKKQLLPHVAVTDEELELLKDFDTKFLLEFRSVPTEKPRGLHEL